MKTALIIIAALICLAFIYKKLRGIADGCPECGNQNADIASTHNGLKLVCTDCGTTREA